jgi:hypothetical protein
MKSARCDFQLRDVPRAWDRSLYNAILGVAPDPCIDRRRITASERRAGGSGWRS